MTTIVPSLADRNRAEAAVNLAARHLSERDAKHVNARQAGGLLVWHVESQTEPGKWHVVTREADGWPADTCDCPGHLWRHQRCKHQRVIDLLAPVPAPVPLGITADSVAVAACRARRVEWEEEI